MSWPDSWLYRLSDPRDAWSGVDKEVHLFAIAFCAALFGIAWALVAGVLVEIVQAALWCSLSSQRRLLIEDGRATWPFFHDRASIKDLIADAAGILLFMLAARFLPGFN